MTGRYRMLGDEGLATYEVRLDGTGLHRSIVDGSAERILTPGFIDIHIHGGFGIDFMSASPEEMTALADRLEEVGYEAFLPTTVSATPDAVLAALEKLPDDPRMPSVHLEGPFISPKFPGAQPQDAIRSYVGPTGVWKPIWNNLKWSIITLAPEGEGNIHLIEMFSRCGRIVSMGHTNATFEEARTGFTEGVRHATHTFNAMRGLHHREVGALGFALLQDEIACELIYDRQHVSKAAAELLFRSKPKEKVIAVSDGTMASGLKDCERFSMWECDVETRNGGVYLAGTETLAGSAITLYDAFRNLAEDFGLETAIRACCVNPRLALSMKGPPKVWLEWSESLDLVRVNRV